MLLLFTRFLFKILDTTQYFQSISSAKIQFFRIWKTFSYFFLLEVAVVIHQQAPWRVLLPVGRGGGAHGEGIGNEERSKF